MKTKLLTLCISAAIASGSLFAKDYTFTNMTTDWQTLVGSDVTTADDSVRAGSGANKTSKLTINFDTAETSATLGNLELFLNAGNTGGSNIVDFEKGTLNVGDIVIGNDYAEGTNVVYVRKDATLNFMSTGGRKRFDIGHRGSGKLVIDGGLVSSGTTATTQLNLGANGSADTKLEGVLELINGGRITNGMSGTFNISVGASTTIPAFGTINVSGKSEDNVASSIITTGNIYVGAGASSTASANFFDGGVLDLTGNLSIASGGSSNGIVNISDNANAKIKGDVLVGSGASSVSSLNVFSNGILKIAGALNIGNGASATSADVNITNGGQIIAGDTGSFNVNIGSVTGASGTLTLDGKAGETASTLGLNGTLAVGKEASTTAILNVKNGAQIKAATGGLANYAIGAGVNSNATVNLSGTDTLMQYIQNGTAFSVGTANGSSGIINVSDGATLELQRNNADLNVYMGTNTAGDANKTTSKININNGGTLLISNFNGSVNIEARSNTDSGIYINQGGTLKFTGAGSEFKLGKANVGSETKLIVDGGSIVSTTSGNINFVINDYDTNTSGGGKSYAYMTLKNGATLINTSVMK